jgi:hypothetical protein
MMYPGNKPITGRGFLLPLVLTLSFLVVFLGVRVPNIAKPSKPRPSAKAVVESQAKECKDGSLTVGQQAELHVHSSRFSPTLHCIDTVFQKDRIEASVCVDCMPARAPPLADA